MQKVLLLLILLLASTASLLAQNEPNPNWMRQIFPNREDNFRYVAGMGIGANETSALNDAWANAIQNDMSEAGNLVITSQVLNDIRQKGYDAAILDVTGNAIQRKLAYQSSAIYLSANQVKVYILLMVQKDGRKAANFYKLDDKEALAKMKSFDDDIAAFNKTVVKEKASEKKAVATEASRKADKYFLRGYNKFLSFGLGNGLTYGKAVGLNFMGRVGGIVGFGWDVGAGMGIGLNASAVPYFHYAVGLKFYMYKNLYLGGYFGTVDVKQYADANSNNKWTIGGYKLLNGVSPMLGYDFCFGPKNTRVGGVFSIGAGVSIALDGSIIPAWNVGIGITF